MKTVLLSCFLLSWGFAGAQWKLDKTEYSNVLRFDALQALLSEDYLLSYERTVKRDLSIVLTTGYLGGYWDEERMANGEAPDRSYYVRNGVYIAPEVRYYLTEFTRERRPVGTYVSAYPFTQLSWVEQRGVLRPSNAAPFPMDDLNTPYRANLDIQDHLYGLGAAIGLQVFVLRGITVEAQVNAAVAYRDFEQIGFETDAFETWQVADEKRFSRELLSGARFMVGYAF